MEEQVIYYPNLLGVLPIRLDGQRVLASNDWGTLSTARRHLIDADTLASLSKPPSIIASSSLSSDVVGRGMGDEKVVGVLEGPLEVELDVAANSEEDVTRLTLEGVVVVERLPVSLHISYRCLADEKILHPPSSCVFLSHCILRRSLPMGRNESPHPDHPYWFGHPHAAFMGTRNCSTTGLDVLLGALSPAVVEEASDPAHPK